MSTGLAERAVTGVQTPRLSWMPEGDWDYTLGEQCIEWARKSLGAELDPWEQLALRMLGARRPDGRWACPEFGLCLSRRNGKSHVLVIWFLFCLLVLGKQVVEYTAHHGKTVRSTFKIARKILDAAPPGLPDHRPYVSAGRESLIFETGQEFAFSTRTRSAGRGTGADALAVDEAQEAADDEMDALTPILGDRSMTVPGPQLIYAGSAGDFQSVVFGQVRRRALSRKSSRLGWLEWSIDDEAYWAADTFERERMATAVESMAQANPSLNASRPDGSGLSLDWLLGQIDILSPHGFAREHLGVGTWPKDEGHDWLIPRLKWATQARPSQEVPTSGLVLGLSGTWKGRSASIAVAGGIDGGLCHGWLERQDRGTAWLLGDLKRLIFANVVAAVVMDAGGPLKSMVADVMNVLQPLGVPLEQLDGRNAAGAAGSLFDAVDDDEPTFTHRDQVEVNAALAGARKKDVGSGLWTFDRDKSESDVAPLEALAYARHGWAMYGGVTYSILDSIW